MKSLDESIKEVELYLLTKIKKVSKAWTSSLDEMLAVKGFNFLVMKNHAYTLENSSDLKYPCICLNDGYVSYFNYSNLSRGKVRCNGCTLERYKEKCKLNNFTYLSHRQVENATLIRVKCNIDGCEREVHSSALLKISFECKECLKKKYEEYARVCGFEYIHNALPSPKTVLLRCPDDGHFVRTSTSCLSSNKVGCDVCEINKYKKYLSLKSATYISHETLNGVRKVEYRNEAGEIFKSTASLLTIGNFSVSKSNHWNLPHSLYIIKAIYNDKVYYKIGTAISPEKRMLYLKLKCEASVDTLRVFNSRKDADREESKLHLRFKEYRLPSSEVIPFIGREINGKNNKRKEGATEWFSSDLYRFLTELQY